MRKLHARQMRTRLQTAATHLEMHGEQSHCPRTNTTVHTQLQGTLRSFSRTQQAHTQSTMQHMTSWEALSCPSAPPLVCCLHLAVSFALLHQPVTGCCPFVRRRLSSSAPVRLPLPHLRRARHTAHSSRARMFPIFPRSADCHACVPISSLTPSTRRSEI